MLLLTLGGTMKNAFMRLRLAQVLLGHPLHRAGDPHERRGQRARPAGDERGAAIGGELAVAGQGQHQEERDDVDDERDEQDHEAGGRAVVAVAAAEEEENCRIIAATLAKKLAMVMISTSRFFTCASSCAMTPSSSAGESAFMMPVVAHTVALFCERPIANAFGTVGVRHRDLRLGQVGLDAEPLDHRVEARRLLGGDLLGAHCRERELVREEELGERQAADHDQHHAHAGARREQHDDEAHVEQRRAGTS